MQIIFRLLALMTCAVYWLGGKTQDSEHTAHSYALIKTESLCNPRWRQTRK